MVDAAAWGHYQCHPSFVLGFHGCDAEVGEEVLRTQNHHLRASNNAYDWLGDGIYFWESNPARALQFAQDARSDKLLTKGTIKQPFVIGAVIDLGRCFNLFDSAAVSELQAAFRVMKAMFRGAGEPLPKNRGREFGARFRDAAVIQAVHQMRKQTGTLEPYDTVRGGFFEGGPAYSGAGFSKKAHIQIAVRNPDQIKGYFRPMLKEPPKG